MATPATAVRPALPVPTAERAPHSFQDALKRGWAIVSDKSHQSINQKRREGKLTMRRKGCPGLLEVDYIGTPRGYRFSVPKLANS